MLMRGSHNCPMHRQPFSLMQIQVTTTEAMRIWKPMWLIVIGQRQDELSSTEAYQAYRQRYDIEHLLRFGKQRLLLNASATPEVEHEENWVRIIFLAYVQLCYLSKVQLYLSHKFIFF